MNVQWPSEQHATNSNKTPMEMRRRRPTCTHTQSIRDATVQTTRASSSASSPARYHASSSNVDIEFIERHRVACARPRARFRVPKLDYHRLGCWLGYASHSCTSSRAGSCAVIGAARVRRRSKRLFLHRVIDVRALPPRLFV